MPTFSFSRASLSKLKEVHPVLQKLFHEALDSSTQDFTIICGYRNQKDQDVSYANGMSRLKFPNSKHNRTPAMAIDAAPFPIVWSDIAAFEALADHIKFVWDEMSDEDRDGFHLVWGGSWKLRDLPHFEIRK